MVLDYIYAENKTIEEMSAIVDIYFEGMLLVINRFQKNCVISLNKNNLEQDVYVDKISNYNDLGIIRLDRDLPRSVLIGSTDDLVITLYTPFNDIKKYDGILISSICKYLRTQNLGVFAVENSRISIEHEGVIKSIGTTTLSKTNTTQSSHVYVMRFNSRNDLMDDLLISNNSPCLCMKDTTYDTNTSGLQNYDIDFTQEEFSLGVAQKLSDRIGYTLIQRDFNSTELERIKNLSISRDNDNWRYYGNP